MKRLLVLLLLASASLVHAAISSNAQWEVRTTGSDNNGGGFVAGATGTDFSQQDAAQYTFANLASANGTTNPCVVSSASHNFVASDVGNILHITAGTNWLTGWYSIVSVAANNATLDRNCASAASVSSGTFFVGGGFATIAQAVAAANCCVDGAGGTFDGVINIKAGTYTLTAAIAPNTNYGLAWVGYQTTHGDNGTAPLITTATNSTTLISLGGSSHMFDNLRFSNAAVTPSAGITTSGGTALRIRNATFSGFTNAIASQATWTELLNVEVKNSTAAGIANGGITICVACYIHDNTGDGLQLANGVVINSISAANGGIGLINTASPGQVACVNSDIANNTSDGARSNAGWFSATDCVFYGNGGWGINGPGTGDSNTWPYNVGQNNAFGSNASGSRTGIGNLQGTFGNTGAALNDLALTANPFTSATNFAPNATAGGGAVLKGAGFPGAFPGGTTTGTLNIGGVQASGAAAPAHAQGYGGGYSPP